MNDAKKQSAHKKNHRQKKDEIICKCNSIPRSVLESAICEGCDTMNKIFDATTAGVGPCGGSCRRKIVPMLEHYLQTGTFPEKITEDQAGKVKPAKIPNDTE